MINKPLFIATNRYSPKNDLVAFSKIINRSSRPPNQAGWSVLNSNLDIKIGNSLQFWLDQEKDVDNNK